MGSIDIPKPKRERKKSKSKSGEEGEESAKGDFAKVDVVEKGDAKKSAADAVDKIEKAGGRKDVGATSPPKASSNGSAGFSEKSKSTEKVKKSPNKKVLGPDGEGHD